MLLRRVIEHVSEQNWTAVAIDFVIVVVGVFIGIQVANWNEHRSDLQRASDYIDRLTQEMELNRQTLAGRTTSYASQIENGLSVIENTSKPDNRESAWEIIRGFFQASHAFTFSLQRGTYDEIISSGDLALLRDQELVDALSAFYTFGGFSTIGVIPDYRENVRRIIPFKLQRYLLSQCYEITMPDTHKLLDCPAPVEGEDLMQLASKLLEDIELKQDLRYMLSFAGVSGDIAKNRVNQADHVLTLLRTSKN